ncbi:aldehyde dehydrogenase family protein [Rhodococcus koreensis]
MSDIQDIINPATEEVLDSIAGAEPDVVDKAVARATEAQRVWARESPATRAKLLRDFAAGMQAARADLADLEISNAGHLPDLAFGGVDNFCDILEYSAGGVERLLGEQIPVSGGIAVTFMEPVGVVAVIVPWNFPLVIAGRSIGPSLAAGNAVIIKPAELTPLSALRIERIALESGLPEGLLQVVPGRGSVVGERLVTHPGIGHVVFTGSTEVGKRVMAQASQNVTGVSLELGGKSANIIFDDADLAAAAAGVPGSCFDNAGQDCCARSRILVQRNVMERFMELLEPTITGLKVGNPRDEGVDVGPLISAGQRDRVAGLLDNANIAFQASLPDGSGFWFPPTVVAPVEPDSNLWREEIFGPVVAVVPFDDEADAIRLANDTIYGLSGSIWTRDVARALRTARAVEGGNLSVNSNSSVRHTTPFSGMKQSGLGSGMGPHALAQFTNTKTVFVNTDN